MASSNMLRDSTQRYVYGRPAERLSGAANGTTTWYLTDALGLLRATLNDAGLPMVVASYDAWGVPETPLIGSFGFTGELQRGNDVWLRARWYGAGRGGFASRDPYAGDAQTPYSLQYYQYGYSNPVSLRDPSGRKVDGTDVRMTYSTSPSPSPVLPFDNNCSDTSQDTITLHLTDLGIILGLGFNLTVHAIDGITGRERVYDLLSFSKSDFLITGGVPIIEGNKDWTMGGINVNWFGLGGGYYVGGFTGLSTYDDQWTVLKYAGISFYRGFSVQTPFDYVSVDSTWFTSQDGHLSGNVTSVGLGASIWPLPLSLKFGLSNADPVPGTLKYYRTNFQSWSTWWDGQDMLQDMRSDLMLISTLVYIRTYMVVEDNAREWEKLETWRQTHPGMIWGDQQP